MKLIKELKTKIKAPKKFSFIKEFFNGSSIEPKKKK